MRGDRLMPYSDPDKQREYQRKWMQREGRSKPAIGTKRFFYSSCSKLKIKARDNNIEFNLDSKYLQDIFPRDSKCPALGFTFKRKSNRPPKIAKKPAKTAHYEMQEAA